MEEIVKKENLQADKVSGLSACSIAGGGER